MTDNEKYDQEADRMERERRDLEVPSTLKTPEEAQEDFKERKSEPASEERQK